MQLSQTLSSAIAQIKASNSPITNHTNKFMPQRPAFQLFFFVCLWLLLLLLKKDFEGSIDVYPL